MLWLCCGWSLSGVTICASWRKANEITYNEFDIITTLQKKLAANEPWRELILGADDDEVAASTSDFDCKHERV